MHLPNFGCTTNDTLLFIQNTVKIEWREYTIIVQESITSEMADTNDAVIRIIIIAAAIALSTSTSISRTTVQAQQGTLNQYLFHNKI